MYILVVELKTDLHPSLYHVFITVVEIFHRDRSDGRSTQQARVGKWGKSDARHRKREEFLRGNSNREKITERRKFH